MGWGFEDASRLYFNKPAARLDLDEAALLVGLLPSPNGRDPCSNPQAALGARNGVLSKMVDTGHLSSEQAHRASRRPIALAGQACHGGSSGSGGRRPVPYYTDQVRLDLGSLLGDPVAAEGNFLVETHLDPLLQQVVERRLGQLLAGTRPAVSEGGADAEFAGLLGHLL